MGRKSLEDLIRESPAPTQTAPAPVQAQQPKSSRLAAFMRSLTQGVTSGWGDELAAGARMAEERDLPLAQQSQVNPFQEQLALGRENLKQGQKEYPGTSLAGEMTGGAMQGLGVGKALGGLVGPAATRLGSMAQNALTGLVSGGLYGAGTGEGTGDALRRTATGAATGAAVGGVLGAFGGNKSPAPTTDQLKQQSQNAYAAVKNAGVELSPQSTQSLPARIEKALVDAGFDPDVHQETAAALKSLNKVSGQALDFGALDLKRQLFRDASMDAAKAGDRRLANVAIHELDNYVGSLTPADVTAGNPSIAQQAIAEARKYWGRYAKADTIDKIMDVSDVVGGQFSVSGKENAIRTGFRQLYKHLVKNQGEASMYSDAELEAIKKVAQGGPIENLTRLLGKAAIRGPVSAIPSGIALKIGGPPLAIGTALAGEAGRAAASGMTMRNARLASELIRSGGAGRTFTPSAISQMLTGAFAQQAVNPADEEAKRRLVEQLRSK